MQSKRDGLVPIGEVFGGLDGPVIVLPSGFCRTCSLAVTVGSSAAFWITTRFETLRSASVFFMDSKK